MSLIQAVRLLDLQNVMELNAPGDPRLWDVLSDTLGGITVQLTHLLCLEWDNIPDRVPGVDEWTDWMALEGNLGISVSQHSDSYCLQKRKKGPRRHSLEQLVYDWMKIQGYPLPKRIWFAENYVITGGDGGNTARAFESMRGLMGLGSRSGIWDENTEDCRLVTPGTSLGWPYHFETKLKSVSINKKYFLQSLNSETNLLTSRYALAENTGKGTPAAVLVDSPMEVWQNYRQPTTPANSAMSELGPEHFLIALPKNAQFEKISDRLRDFIEGGASLKDRFPGVIRYRESAATLLHLEDFPDAASVLSPFEFASTGGKNLYAISPWDFSNQILSRRVENFLSVRDKEDIQPITVVPGTVNWVGWILRGLSSTTGWMMPEMSAQTLVEWNEARLASSNLILFWTSLDGPDVADLCGQHGLDYISLGEATQTRQFAVGEQTVPIVEISCDSIREEVAKGQVISATWFYKDQKSPTYGFEKAGIFPDRFLKRMCHVGIKEEIQKGICWGISSSPVHRDILMKNKANLPISYLRWSDGESLWADSVASVDGIAEYHPKALGEWAADMAMRGLVCKGVDPLDAIYAQAWLNNPNATDQPEFSERSAAFYLANRGVKEAFEGYGFHFAGVSFAGTFSKARPFIQELVVRLRGRVPKNMSSVFPGFRMAGEILYVLGPKPAFMDAGTRLLPHFKVVSNHVSSLNRELQLEMYSVLHSCIRDGIVTVARPVGQSGALGAVLEMSLWGNIGATLKPGLTTMELFSGAPGRIVVGVLPQEAKKFESVMRKELINPVGESAGDRIFGQALNFYRSADKVTHASL